MPVTFETDLKDLKEQPYVQQIPLDAMFRNMGYKQSQYDQGVQHAQAIAQSAANVLRGYGPDEKVASDLKSQLNDQLQQFAGLDFSQPENINKLNNYVNSVVGSPDVQGIAARTTKFEADQRLIKEYQDKGKEVPLFLQPSLVGANKYYASGRYDPTLRFRGEITTAPDLEKLHKSIVEKLEPEVDAQGNKSVSPERYAAAFKAEIASNPQLESYFKALHDATYSNVSDWDGEAARGYTQEAQSWRRQANYHAVQAQNAQLTPAERQIHDQAADQATKAALQAEAQISNQNRGEVYKAHSLENFINDIASKRGEAFGYKQQSHTAYDEYIKTQKSLQEIQAQAAAAHQAKEEEQVLQARLDAGIYEDPSNPGSYIPGKAEIAGETASLKKKYSASGTGVVINSNMDDFHKYAKATDDPDFAKGTDGKTKNVDLTKGVLESLGVKDAAYGKGWRQVNNESFLKNWKRDNGIEVNAGSPTISVKDGAPEIYIKGNRLVVGINEGAGEVTYRDVNANNLFSAEYNHAGAKEKPLLMQYKAENVSGNYSEHPTNSYSRTDAFVLGAKTYTYDQIKEAADKSHLSVEDYVKAAGAKKK